MNLEWILGATVMKSIMAVTDGLILASDGPDKPRCKNGLKALHGVVREWQPGMIFTTSPSNVPTGERK